MTIGDLTHRARQVVAVEGIWEGAHGKIKGNGLWRAQPFVCTAFLGGRGAGSRGVRSAKWLIFGLFWRGVAIPLPEKTIT